MSISQEQQNGLVQRLFVEEVKSVGPFVPALAYLLVLILGLEGDASTSSLAFGVPAFVVFFLVLPFLSTRKALEEAFRARPEDTPEKRLVRILQVPRQLELQIGNLYMWGTIAFVGACLWRYGGSWTALLVSTFVIAAINTLAGIRTRLQAEEILQPQIVAEFHRDPTARPHGPWFFWPRQSWYLPYSMAAVLVTTLTTIGVTVAMKARRAMETEFSRLGASIPPETIAELRTRAESLASELLLPVVLLGALVLATSMATALQLARRNARASRSLQQTVQSLADGNPKPPDWLSTDELGDVSLGLAGMLEKLRTLALGLRRSGNQLFVSAERLGASTADQNRTLGRQAAAIHETQVTAQEIRQTSELASERTKALMKLVDRADEVGRMGEAAIERTLDGLKEIRGQVDEIAGHVRGLGERARQVASITATVKDLADQSNMLALNAAIEAVRSGEHGKGFGVVAREIRSLADQSLQATHQVRERLQDIGEAIQRAVEISERGAAKIEASFSQVRASGDSLKELSGIVRENASSVRQIAGAVSQQNAGITQVFEAIRELSGMMDDTMKLVERTKEATQVVKDVAADVNEVVRQHGVTDAPEPAAPDRAA